MSSDPGDAVPASARPLTVSEAVAGRRSIRAFRPDPVEPAIVRQVLEKARQAPSGGNLQPWNVFLVHGATLARLRARMVDRLREKPDGEGENGEGVDFDIYPRGLGSPYLERKIVHGETLYGSVGVARDDAAGRRAWHERNYALFDAPIGAFFYVDRTHGRPQWGDVGMYLMAVMLLLREAGLESCPQECWARYARTVDAILEPPPGLMLYTGMAIGVADWTHPINRFPPRRAEPQDFLVERG